MATEKETVLRRPDIQFLLTLSLLLGFASISTDLFLPALPAMQAAMAAKEGTLQFAISAYLLGFGLGQLLWGPISDRYGRRTPIAFGILLFAVGSAGCALSSVAWQLIAWRVVQAVGASAGVALARAMIRDLFERDEAARLLSTLMTVMAIAPMVGPSVGAQILEVASWRMIFWTLVAIGVLAFGAVSMLPETLPPEKRESGSILLAFDSYRSVASNRSLLIYAAILGCYYTGIFANIAGAAFAFISYHGVSPRIYGLIFASGVFGVMAANLVNARLVVRLGSDRMLLLGVLGATLFGVLAAVITSTDAGGVWGLATAQFLFGAMNGFIVANGVAGALATVQTRVGAASAVVGAIQYGSGVLGSGLVGLVADGTPAPMGFVMAASGLGCLLLTVLLLKMKRKNRAS